MWFLLLSLLAAAAMITGGLVRALLARHEGLHLCVERRKVIVVVLCPFWRIPYLYTMLTHEFFPIGQNEELVFVHGV